MVARPKVRVLRREEPPHDREVELTPRAEQLLTDLASLMEVPLEVALEQALVHTLQTVLRSQPIYVVMPAKSLEGGHKRGPGDG